MSAFTDSVRKRLRDITEPPPVIPVLRLEGVINADGMGRRRGISMARLAEPIEKAFAVSKAPAVALVVNSPGGSPVQSSLIARRIRDLAEEKNKRVIAFVEDVAASGGYWLAAAGDEIYADRSSIVGSIGVIAAFFGFHDFIGRWGVERRVYTAGERKLMADPFQPEKAEDVARIKLLQADIHQAFINHVRERRGPNLAADDETLFNGDVWTGERALDLGLVDGIGHLRPVLRDRFGDRVRFKVFGGRGGLLSRLGMGQGRLGHDLAAGAVEAVEERAHWQRFGL